MTGKQETPDAQKPRSVAADWPHFVEHIQQNRPPLGYHLSVAYVVSMSGKSIDLRFPKAFHFQFSEVIKKKNRDEIQKELNDFFQDNLDLHITLESAEEPPAAGKPAAGEPKSTMSLDDEIAHEPIIRNVLDIFDGTLV